MTSGSATPRRRYALTAARKAVARRRADQALRERTGRLEEALREQTSRAEAAEKELELLAYAVSHDLKGPLWSVHGISSLLYEDLRATLPAEAAHHLRLLCDETARITDMVNGLLNFSRVGRQSFERRPADVGKLARGCLEKLRSQWEGRQLAIEVAEMPPCEADPALVGELLLSLLSNALKFTHTQETGRIEIGSREQDGEEVYFVKDNGAGFDQRHGDKLFAMFQRLHGREEWPGTGVGLAIAQRIVHRHGGRIWGQGAVGQGATFYFTLGERKRSLLDGTRGGEDEERAQDPASGG
ncbi:MAG: two-component sensor histidine kinase [Deltaproteobacteria bacterium]|nr:two-component sensor histidine kinase [Deltaproteobacteria bacterium]